MENIKGTNESFIKKAILKHGYKYDYSLIEYNGAKKKIKIICPIHGIFEQQPTNHLMGQGCPICSGNIILTINNFIIKANVVHNHKYDYSLVEYINSTKKVNIICPIHGIFKQSGQNHLRGDSCPSCIGNKRLTLSEFIEKSIKRHGNKYGYSLVEYTNNSNKVKIICNKHGVFEQTPNNHINGNGCPKCKESKGETIIRVFLNENNIKFIRQYRFKDCRDKQPLPFDFYLPEYNMCVEFNGRQHYQPVNIWGGELGLKNIKNRDTIKMEYCKNNNIPLLIIKYNEDIIKKLDNKLLINPKTKRPKL